METTLSGTYTEALVDQAKRKGYRVEMVYIYVDDPDVNVARVAARVCSGGHDVPEEDVRRRYYRSKYNLWERLRGLVDLWELYHSDGTGTRMVAKREGDESVTFLPGE